MKLSNIIAQFKAPPPPKRANKKEVIYIAGKVTGLPIHKTTMKFGQSQKILENMGYEVVNPIALVNNWNTTWEDAMVLCIAALIKCDCIYLLPDWQESKGARIEKKLAEKLNLKIF